jgi:hypothetical protein
VGVPPSLWQQAGSAIPGLGGLTSQASQNIMGELKGQLSPETIQMIQDHAASFGVGAGMPGSGFAINTGLRSLGLTAEQLQQQGLQNYLSTIQGVGGLQQNPALMAQIATQNAIWNSAPDPAAASAALQSQYLQNLQYGNNLANRYLPSPSGYRGPVTLGPAPNYGPAGGTGQLTSFAPGDPNNPATNDISVAYGPQDQYTAAATPELPSWMNPSLYGSSGPGTFYAGGNPTGDTGTVSDIGTSMLGIGNYGLGDLYPQQ